MTREKETVYFRGAFSETEGAHEAELIEAEKKAWRKVLGKGKTG